MILAISEWIGHLISDSDDNSHGEDRIASSFPILCLLLSARRKKEFVFRKGYHCSTHVGYKEPMICNHTCAVPHELTYRNIIKHAVALTLKESVNRSN